MEQIQTVDSTETTIKVVRSGQEIEAEAFCFDAYKETGIHYSVVLPEDGSRHGQKYSVTLARKAGQMVKVLPMVALTRLNIEALGLDVEADPERRVNIIVEVSEVSYEDFMSPMPTATQDEQGLAFEGEEGSVVEWLDIVERVWGLHRADCAEQLAELGYDARKVWTKVYDEIEDETRCAWLVVVDTFCEGYDNACIGQTYHEVMNACQDLS